MTQIPSSLRPTASPLALKWNFDNKLKAADTDDDGTDDVFYRWDALGRRVGRDDGTSHVIYFQDGHQTLADYPAGGAASSPAYTYVYGSYIDEVILRNEGGGARYYHRNQQYSIIALTDVGGAVVERYAYTAYGQVTFANASGTVQTASASNNRYTYTGREWDAGLSLYHFRARMYDPVAGRFISRDPYEYWDGLNTYRSYISLIGLDPLGLECEIGDCKAIAATCAPLSLSVSAVTGGGKKTLDSNFIKSRARRHLVRWLRDKARLLDIPVDALDKLFKQPGITLANIQVFRFELELTVGCTYSIRWCCRSLLSGTRSYSWRWSSNALTSTHTLATHAFTQISLGADDPRERSMLIDEIKKLLETDVNTTKAEIISSLNAEIEQHIVGQYTDCRKIASWESEINEWGTG